MKARFTRLLWFSFVWLLSNVHPATASAPFALAPPDAPTGLGGTVVSASQINVSWNASAGATAYDLDYSTVADFSASVTTVADLAGTSTNVTGLNANTTYHFRVRAKNGDGPSGHSAAIARLTRPGPPTLDGFTNVQATSLRVNWTAHANGQSGFVLERATNSGFSGSTTTAIADGGATGADVTGLAQATSYWFRVRATNASGESENSNESSTTTLLLPPAAPTVSAAAASGSEINLSWAGYSSNQTGFDVRRATAPGGLYTTIASDLAAGQTAYSATGLTDGTTYYFQVVAKNTAGNTPSNTASATTPINAPSGLGATAFSSSQINLAWTDNSGSETGYEIFRGNSAGGPYTSIADNVTATTYSATGLNENTTYYFVVRAKNGTGSSGNSSEASATTILNPPAAPTLQPLNVVSNVRIDLTWTDNATNEAEYLVDRSADNFGTFTTIATLGANANGHQATGLSGNTPYWFRVRAKNASGEAASEVKTATTLPDPPGEPQSFAASAVEATTLTLSWSAPATGGAVGNYELGLPVAPGSVTQTGTTYNVTGLTPGTNYSFQVRAQNAGGISNFVGTSALTKPGAPTGLGASSIVQTTLTLTWSSPGGVVSGYDVDQAPAIGGPWTTIATNVGTTSYGVTGLTANTTYFFRVRANNATGASGNSIEATATTLPNPPAAPTGLAISAPVTATNQLTLTWTDNADNEVSYEVERSENGGGFAAIATGLAANSTGYPATGLSANTLYAFRVRARNTGGPSGYSNEPSALTLPDAPGGLSATVPGPPTGITQINLSWSAPGGAGTLTGYKLDYATSAGFSPVTTVDVSGTSHSLTGLTPNTQYFFRVRAVNASGESASSGSANATTLPTPPTAPTGLSATASATSPNTINLTWTDAATNETGYEVERSANTNGSFSKIADLGADATSYPSGGLSSNTTYFYRVRAKNTGGESGYSNEASALTIPDAPSNLAVSVPGPPNGITKLSLTWNAPSGSLTGYDLEYATNAGFTGSQIAAVGGGATSYTLEGLTQNTTYSLRLRAKNATGPSPNSNEVSATTLPNPPGVPTGLNAANVSANGFTINWTAPGGPLTGYVLDVATDNGFGTIVQSFTPGSGATSQVVGSLNANTTYFFRIKAQNTGGESQFSAPANQLTLPAAPDGFVIQGPPTVSAITLAWTALGSAVTEYELRYSTNPDPSGGTVVTLANNGSPHTVSGLAANTRYYFQLRARNATGLSAPTATIDALTLPAQPQNFAIQGGSVQATQVTVQWNPPSPNPDSYTLTYSTDPGLAGASTLTPGGGSTNQVVSGLTPNTTYYFRLTANNATGGSAPTAIVSQLTLPAAPASLTVSNVGTTTLTLTWPSVGGLSGYQLQYSTAPDGEGGVTQDLNDGTATTTNVSGLSPNTTYYFKLRARNATGLSAPASAQQLTLPNPPSGFAVQSGSVTATGLTLTWTPPGGSLEKYELLYSTAADATGGSALDVDGGTDNFAVSGLSPNTTYYFKLRAKNATGFSGFTPIVQQLTLPAAPAGFAVQSGSVTTSGLTVQWTALGGIDYELKYSTAPNGEGGSTINVAAPAAGAATRAITGLAQNTTYYFKLRAKNATGLSEPASAQQLTLPNPPTALNTTNVADVSLTLNWTSPGGSLSGYELKYSTNADAEGGTTTTLGDVASTPITGLAPNTTYYFKLRANNATGTSDYSAILPQLTLPVQPQNLIVQGGSVTTSGLTLSWTAPASNPASYELSISPNPGVSLPIVLAGSATSYPVTGLAQNTSYTFELRAKNATGLSTPASVQQLTLPAAPTGLSANPVAATSVTINWTPPGGSLSGYDLEYSTDNTFASVTTLNPGGGTSSQAVGGLTANTTYYVRLRAKNATGNSAYSATLTVLTRPAAPTSLVAAYVRQRAVLMQWVAPVPGAGLTGYQLQVATDAGFSQNLQTLTPAGGAVSFDVVTGLSPQTTYYFRLRAKNTVDESGYGDYSNVVSVTTPPDPPVAPVFLAATGLTQTSMFINWTPVTGGPVSGYTLEFSRNANFSAPLDSIVINNGGTGRQQITGLTSKTVYYFRIRAFNAGGYSPYSTVQQVQTLPDPPSAPTNFNVTVGSITQTTVGLSWVAPATADQTGYELQYSTDPTFAGTTPSVSIAGGELTYTLTGLAANTTYYLRLRATNLGGGSIPAEATFTTLPNPPAAPNPVAVVTGTLTQTDFTLGWTAPTGPITGYTLDISTSQTFASGVTTYTPAAGATTFPIAGLTQNTTYYVRLRANNTGGPGTYSATLPVTTLPVAPLAPAALTASAISAGGLTLGWTAPSGPITNYVLEYSTDNTFATGVTTLNPAGSASSQPITGLAANTTYFFRLKAVNAGGDSPYTTLAPPATTLPSPPTNLQASAIAQTTLTLTWTAPGGTLTGYQLRYSTAPDPSGAAPVAVGAGPPSFDVAGLSPNTTYYFQLTALNGTGPSLTSAVLQVQTLPNAPAAPTGLSASGLGTTGFTLGWTPPAPPIGSYTLEYSTDNTFGTGVTTLNPAGSATGQPISGLSANTTYFFRLSATNGGGTSPYSSVLSVTTLPTAPTGLTASVPGPPTGTTQIDLSWTAPGGTLTGYELQRATDAGFTQNVTNVPVTGTPPGTTVGGLTANTAYWFRLRAVGAGGPSAYVVTNATTLPNAPAAPVNLNATAIAQTTLTLTWAAPGGPLSGYTLEYSTDNTFATGVTTLNPGGGATSQPISGLSANTTYFFRLRATNAGGSSPNAATQATTLPNLPGVPTGFAATATSSSQINLSWTPGGGQTAQELQYSTSASFASNVQNVPVAADATGASVTGLAEGTTYYFRLRGQNTAGFSGYATAQATTLTNPPNGPSNLSANAVSPSQINLGWTDNSGNETGFYIERATGGDGFTQIAQVGAGATSYSSNGLGENTTYRFRVRAFNSAGTSGYSNEASATTPFSLPAAPTNLSANATGQTTINLSWSDNAGNETNYDVEQSTNGTTFTRIAQLGAGANSYGVTGLTANTAYSFRVRATNPAGASGYSNVAQARTLPNPPAAPGNLAAGNVAQTTVTLTWRDNSDNETRFEIERSGDGTTFGNVGNAAANATQFAVTGLALETRYFFRLRAVNDGGGSAYSNVVEVLTLPIAPRAPTNLRASDTTQTTLRLTWVDNATDDTGYEVLRADTTTGALRKIADLPANSTTYVAATLLVDKLYRFAVRAVGPGGPSANSNEIQAQTLPFAPAAPTQVQAQAVNRTTLLVRWRNPGGPVSQIRVEQSLDGKTFAPARTLPPSPQSANVENLQPNTIYFYRLQAVNRGGVSPYSAVVTDTTFGTPPAAPTALRTDALQARSLRLRWTDNATDEAGFEVEQFRNNRFERIAQPTANTDSFAVAGLTDQTEYRFRVRARNRSGFSDYSNELRVTTPLGVPEAPVNLTVANDRGGPQITLKWTVPLKRVTDSLEVERSLDGQPYQVIQRLPGALDSTVVSGLVLGERYLFRVRARNRSGYSPYSNVVERRSLPTGLEPQPNARVRIQPNPVDADVLVETEDGKNRLRTVEVFNTLGSRVFRWEASGPERGRTLSLGDLPAGVYILSAETDHGTTRQKVLKR